jgi:LCP family protein required for cell wall assembly
MAYFYGEGSKLPGGGPELARKTVEQFIGVPVQYYAQIDFNTFVEFIDLIGGIDIDNQETLRLDPVGQGKDKIKLTCCGIRHLNGEKALAYARFRKDKEGDIARSQRQQKVVIARYCSVRHDNSMRNFRLGLRRICRSMSLSNWVCWLEIFRSKVSSRV